MILTEVSFSELVFGEEYYVLKKHMWNQEELDRIEGYYGTYDGTIMNHESMLRFTRVHKQGRVFGMELMPIESCTFYTVTDKLLKEVFLGNIMPYI
jgi:hypothetical protein